jgi:uncharacterized RDD family membrane protein YckC
MSSQLPAGTDPAPPPAYQPYYGAYAPAGGPPLPPGVKLSGAGKRFGAFCLDGLLMLVTLYIGWFIWSLCIYGRGQTPAKSILHMRVVSTETGRSASYGKMLLREWVGKGLIGLASEFTLGILYFWLLWDDQNQELWDKLAGTIVVDDPNDVMAPDAAATAGGNVAPPPGVAPAGPPASALPVGSTTSPAGAAPPLSTAGSSGVNSSGIPVPVMADSPAGPPPLPAGATSGSAGKKAAAKKAPPAAKKASPSKPPALPSAGATIAPAKKSPPVKTTGAKAAPVKVPPAKAAPVKAAPVKATPVKAAPVKAAPVKAAKVPPTKSVTTAPKAPAKKSVAKKATGPTV